MSKHRRIRMSDADFAALRERVCECAPEIAEAYWGPPVYVDRNEMRFGRNTGSLRLTLWPPDERGLWVDFGDDNRGGDMFTAMRERCGGDWDLTLEEACRRTGFRPTSCDVDLSDEQAQILAESARKRAEARAREQAQAKPKRQGTGAYALQLFEKSRPIAGTLAERYVRDIRLGGHDLPLPGELRYHPSVWSRETASEHQALIIGCHDDGKLVRVQAVLLDHRTGKKANVKSPKLTFGAGVAHVPASLSPWNTDEPQFHLLAEGPEDAIVLNACTGWRVDASLGAGSLHKPHYQAGTRLVIVGDNGETGHTQAERAATVHRAAGCDVIVIYPPEDAKDANDVLLQGGPDAVKAWIEEGLKAKPRQDTEELTPGSPADIYLTETCCIPRPADGWPSCVRRLLPQGAEPEAIALLATDAEGRVIGCQRVEIIDDGKKPLTVAGGIVRLPGPANGPLQIVRGMQPALSVWAATGFETWIALDSLAKLPLPTDRLVIACRDDDPQSSPADKALRLAVAAWQRSGHTVRIATPRDIRRYDKSDFNTVIKCDGIDTVRARIDAAITVPEFTKRVPVKQARQHVHRVVRQFVDVVRNHKEGDPVAVLAAKIGLGLGKSTVSREEVAKLLVELRAAADGRSIVFLVPTHSLGKQAADAFNLMDIALEAGLTAAVWRGREREDPDAPGQTMCRDLERVDDAMKSYVDIETACCRKKTADGIAKCPFFDECAYQRQKVQRADVWFAAHELLFMEKPAAMGDVAAVVLDETFWQDGLEPPKTLSMSQLKDASVPGGLDGQRLQFLRSTLADALAPEDYGPVRRTALSALALNAASAADAYPLEWRMKLDPVSIRA